MSLPAISVAAVPFSVAAQASVVAHEAADLGDPGQGPLHDPTWQNLESNLARWFPCVAQQQPECVFGPGDQFAAVARSAHTRVTSGCCRHSLSKTSRAASRPVTCAGVTMTATIIPLVSTTTWRSAAFADWGSMMIVTGLGQRPRRSRAAVITRRRPSAGRSRIRSGTAGSPLAARATCNRCRPGTGSRRPSHCRFRIGLSSV